MLLSAVAMPGKESIESNIGLRPGSIDSQSLLPERKRHVTNPGKKFVAGLTTISVIATMLGQPKSPDQSIPNSETDISTSGTMFGEVIRTDLTGIKNQITSVKNELGYVVNAIEVGSVLKDMQDRYGVTIPAPSDEFSQEDFNNPNNLTPNIVPDLEQAEVIEKAISLLPSPDYLAPLLICFRNTDEGAVAGGAELGFQWPAFLHPSLFKNFPPNDFPYDRFVNSEAAIELDLPDAKLSGSLPKKTNDIANLPIVEQIAIEGSKAKVNSNEQVPWTTQGERLEQVVVHEYFHAIDEKFSIANSSSPANYFSKQTFLIYDMSTSDITNPLYVDFARINGWKLTPEIDIIKEYDPKNARKQANNPALKTTMFWERDPKIWGDPAHRKNRITTYASYGPIQEAMAEYWMAYKLYPNLLKPKERAFFKKIDEGIRNNPQEFIKEVIKNPDILLKNSPPVSSRLQ